jgi:hypothetical protein
LPAEEVGAVVFDGEGDAQGWNPWFDVGYVGIVSSEGKTPVAVVPAKAGTHFDFRPLASARGKAKWIPAFAGMTARDNTQKKRPGKPGPCTDEIGSS